MKNKISGLYKEVFSSPVERKTIGTELELRVDIDGERPLNAISGDLYLNSERSREYLSSFVFATVKKIITSNNEIQLIGKKGKFSPTSKFCSDIQVTIPEDLHSQKATVQWKNISGSNSRCLCKLESRYFRSINLEHDYEKGVAPLEPYETTNLLSSSPHRSYPINIVDAYAEAGIEIIAEERRNSVDHPKEIPEVGAVWTQNELHRAMLEHFTSFGEEPQWNVWLLSANEYVMSNIKGTAINQEGKKRRGCAVFQDATGWKSAEEKRLRLFIYVHEIGHCFNLHHPWNIPQTDQIAKSNERATLSWMNLPWLYYSTKESRGPEAFWKVFNFQFSNSELMHLRHGFRNDVIFGGNAF